MEKLHKEFGDKVQFVFCYTREAHPDDGPDSRREASPTGGWRMKDNKVKIDEHKTYKDRLKAAQDLKQAGKDDWLVLVDAMDNRTQESWGNLPNMAFLIDPQGRIAHKWSWVASSTGSNKRGGDGDTKDVYTLLKGKDLTRYSIADDPQLPLYDTGNGEWLTYETPDGEVTVSFEPGGDNKIKRSEGDETSEIELKAPEIEKPAKVKEETFKVGKVELPCIVVKDGDTETWYSSWLPGDAVVKVIEGDTTTRELKDAGFEEGESCLTEFDPEAE